MHDLLFTHQKNLEEENLRRLASRLHLNMAQFEQCMTERRYQEEVKQDIQSAQEASINGTPTFLIGVTRPESDEITVIRSLRGAQPYEQFKTAIDAVLENR